MKRRHYFSIANIGTQDVKYLTLLQSNCVVRQQIFLHIGGISPLWWTLSFSSAASVAFPGKVKPHFRVHVCTVLNEINEVCVCMASMCKNNQYLELLGKRVDDSMVSIYWEVVSERTSSQFPLVQTKIINRQLSKWCQATRTLIKQVVRHAFMLNNQGFRELNLSILQWLS